MFNENDLLLYAKIWMNFLNITLQERTSTNEQIPHDFKYIKHKNRQNSSQVVRSQDSGGNVPFLDLGAGYTDVMNCDGSLSHTFVTGILFCVYINISKVFYIKREKESTKESAEETVTQPLPGFRAKTLGAAPKCKGDKTRRNLWDLEQRDERTLGAVWDQDRS